MLVDNKSLFASTELHSKELTMLDGTKETFYFRELTSAQYRKYLLIESTGSYEEKSENIGDLISISLVGADGKQALTREQAIKLKPAVTILFFNEILKINTSSPIKPDEDGEEQGKL